MAGLTSLDQITALEGEVNRLGIALRLAEGRLREARQAAAEFHVGDVVEARRRYPKGPEWQEAVIREVHPSDYPGGQVWYTASFRRKNGEWANVLINVFSDVRAVGSGA